jgi:DNA-binding beta-propeller fold protein YncE
VKRLALAFGLAALAVPGAARAGACSPLDCAPSQFSVAGSPLVGYRPAALGRVTVFDLRTGAKRFVVPGGYVGGHLLVHQAGGELSWYDLRTGTKTATVQTPWPMQLAGVSQDGARAVGLRSVPGVGRTVIIVSRVGGRQLPLPAGRWSFDALRGRNLFLIHSLATGGYQVVVEDVSTDSPTTRVIKDPDESATISGTAWSHLASPDGRYLFTIYLGGDGGAMVHELDLVHASARCIDLPGTGSFDKALSWTLALSPNGRTLWAASAGYGRVVGIDVGTRTVVSRFPIALPYWDIPDGTRAAVSPDGKRLALADGADVAVVALDRRTVVQRRHMTSVAVGFDPNGVLRGLR